MTHNFSDFDIFTLTLGDIKLKLLTGELAESMQAPGGLLPVPGDPRPMSFLGPWYPLLRSKSKTQCYGPSSGDSYEPTPPPGAPTQRNQVDIKLHSQNPEAPQVPEGAVRGAGILRASVLKELTRCG